MKHNIHKISAAGLFSLVLLSACLLEPDSNKSESDVLEHPIYAIDSISVLSNANNRLSINCFGVMNDPCYSLAYVSIHQSADTIRVTPMTRRDKEAICPMVLAPVNFPVEIDVNTAGEYHLQFRTSGQDLDTTLYINAGMTP